MVLSQLSVLFPGILHPITAVTALLAGEHVHPLGLCYCILERYAVLRLILPDSKKAEEVFLQNRVTYSVCQVLALPLAMGPSAIERLSEAGIGVEYAYSSLLPDGSPGLIVRATQMEEAQKIAERFSPELRLLP